MKIYNTIQAKKELTKPNNDRESGFKSEDHNKAKSLTVPNQSKPIKDIVTRYVQTGQLPESTPTYYDGVDNFDHFEPSMDGNFDLADYSAMAEEIATNQKERKKKAEEEKRSADEKANKEAIDIAVAQAMENKKSEQNEPTLDANASHGSEG